MTAPFDFSALEDAIADLHGYILPQASPDGDGIFERILQILVQSQKAGRLVCKCDLIALLRHVLRRESQRSGSTTHLRVPTSSDWPQAQLWRQYGIRLHSEQSGFGLIDAQPWRPEWLASSDQPVFEEIFAETNVRNDRQREIDPFLGEASGFSHYVSPGQREAVRSALVLPPGETLIVGLPTGSGKSFVAQAPVLARGLESGLVLCVVPTTALVLDQARQMTELLRKRFPGRPIPQIAWHAGLSSEMRDAIKSAIRGGTQGVLYCSPEAVVGALLPALYDAARFNLLSYLVIDEAHLVSQWGDGFRPAFQMLAGVRRGLLAACPTTPFRTILMSGTLAPDTIETIDALFGPARSVQMMASIYLRPEPQYWVYRDDDILSKRRKVLEILRYAPRPFILYVTKRNDADDWLRILKAEGYERVASFHGNTPHAERVAAITAWAENKLDGMVATSAFGVGIDKRDVRTIVHAAVPETLDRFYQEVGRGGRDGCRSGSFLIYSQKDIEVAKGIAAPSLISDDLAFERWAAMYDSADKLDDYGMLCEIDLGTVPDRLRQESDYNQAWNMRTLIMMARAKMLELESQSPARFADLESAAGGGFDADNEDDWAEYFRHTVIRLSQPGHRTKEIFVRDLGAERTRAFKSSNAGQDLLEEMLSASHEFSALLERLYRNHEPGRTIIVSRACGGCPADRAIGGPVQGYAEPTATGIEGLWPFDAATWTQRFRHLDLSSPVYLLFPGPLDAKSIYPVVEALVSTFGIRELCLPASFRAKEPRYATLHQRVPGGMIFLQDIAEERRCGSMYQLPRATIFDTLDIDRALLDLRKPVHVVLASRTASDPDHPLRHLGDTGSNILTQEQFLRGARS
ncbi:protein DpdF [Sphingopyxis granuli]|uniref:protein DpdF n=1 Tax=Sphingopyxis granuli TaxID=267128 RepID=UPI0009ED31B1|nr:protein DpdF [Sphingopyxis granuli]